MGALMPLGLLAPGEDAIVDGPSGADPLTVRAEALGLRPGRSVRMLTNGGGPLLVKVDESRIALDRTLAMRIRVRRHG